MDNQADNNAGKAPQSLEERIRREQSVSPLVVGRVYKGNYDEKGEETAELRQEIHTKSYYPSKQISNSMNDNIFGQEDFKDESHTEHMYENTEKRVGWITIPEGTTVEQVAEKLKAFPNGNLYKVLSNKPILTEEAKYAIQREITTLDKFANGQAIRIPTNDTTVAEGTAGNLVLDPAGKIQYRAIYFSKQGQEDMDHRTADPKDYYMSPELEAEFSKQFSQEMGNATMIESQKL